MPTLMTTANVVALLLALIALPSVAESAPPPPPRGRGRRRRRPVVLRSSARYEGHPTTATRHDDDNRRRRQQGSPAPDAATDDDDDDEAHLPEVGEEQDGGAASAVVESESEEEEEEWYLPGLKAQLARTWLYGAGDPADWGMGVSANVNASADDYDVSSFGSGDIAPVDVPALFAGEHVVDVSAGGMHSAILTDEGRILTAGVGGPHLGRDDANENGNGTAQQMMGFAPVAEVFFPLPLDDDANSTTATTSSSSSSWSSSSPPPRFVKVVASRDFTFALDEAGNAWSTGSNAYAQLCLGDDATRDRFHRVRMPDEEEEEDEGGDGDGVPLFGRDRQRRRRRQQQQQEKKEKEKEKEKIVDIALGERHAILLREDGTAWGCGWNHYGQLGVGASGGNVPGPTRIAIDAPDGDDDDDEGGTATAEGGGSGTTTPVPDHGLIVDIVAGRGSSYFLTSLGHVYATGTNYKGQLCLGHREDRTLPTMLEYDVMNNEGVNVVSMVSGASSLYILLSNGLVLACGENTQGQLGIGSDVIDSVDVPSLVANVTNVTAMFSGPTSLGAYFVSERIIYAVGFDGVGARENWNIPNMMACADEETTLEEGVLISSGNDHTLYLATAETSFECEGDPAAAPSMMPSTPATALSSINHVPSVGPSTSSPPSSSSMPMVIMPSVSPTATSSPSATSYPSSMSKEDDELSTDVPTPLDTFTEFSYMPTSSTPPSSVQASETTRPPMAPTRGVDLGSGANGYPPGGFVLSLLGASVFLCQWL